MDNLAEVRAQQDEVRQSEHAIHQASALEHAHSLQQYEAATHGQQWASLPLVSVFSPKAVFCVTFLMNVLGGFILSAVNWSRLESPAKARTHVIIGAVVFIGLAALIAWAPVGSFVVLLVNLGVAFYLRNATQKDMDDDAGVKRIEIINGWAAFGIGLLGTVGMAVLVVLLKPVMS